MCLSVHIKVYKKQIKKVKEIAKMTLMATKQSFLKDDFATLDTLQILLSKLFMLFFMKILVNKYVHLVYSFCYIFAGDHCETLF